MASSEISSTLAALVGSAIGATGPVISNLISQRGTTQRELLNHQMAKREALYSDFIKDAARLHIHSLTSSTGDMEAVIELHAILARIRLLSSMIVVQAAENFVLQIVVNYGQANLSLDEIRVAALTSKIDPLKEFSAACRLEFEQMGAIISSP